MKTTQLTPELVEKMQKYILKHYPDIIPGDKLRTLSFECAQIAVDYADELVKSKDHELSVERYKTRVMNEAYEKAKQQRDELLEVMREFTNAIESEEITIQENFDNDGWENCGGRIYETFKKLLKKHEDGKE